MELISSDVRLQILNDSTTFSSSMKLIDFRFPHFETERRLAFALFFVVAICSGETQQSNGYRCVLTSVTNLNSARTLFA